MLKKISDYLEHWNLFQFAVFIEYINIPLNGTDIRFSGIKVTFIHGDQ